MKTKLTIATFLMLLVSFQTLYARDEYSRTVKREYNVNPDVMLIVDNMFGKIQCETWEKNVVAIEVTITVVASDEDAAAKMMDKITFTLTGTPERVEARTILEEGRNKGMMTIDYKINMPSTVNLDFTNKFGDIFVNEISGKGKFNLSYGNLEVKKLNNSDNLIDIKFGKANVTSIKGAVVNLKYSEMQVEYAGSLRLDSKFSNLDASKIVALNVNFEGGKLDMDNTSALESHSKFSDINVGRIEKTLDLDIQYGNADIEEMPADFTSITIINKYGNVSVGIPEGAGYSLSADLKFCELDFPSDDADFSQKIITNTTKTYRANVGKPGGKVSVRSDFGNVSLQ